MREGGYLLRYQLQFFAKDGPGGEKTEEATPKKLEDARKEGQVSKSKDLGNFVMLFFLFLILKIFLSYIGGGLLESFHIIYGRFSDITADQCQNFNIRYVGHILRLMMGKILLIILPVLAISVLVSFIMDLAQVKWKVTTKPLMPKFNKLNFFQQDDCGIVKVHCNYYGNCNIGLYGIKRTNWIFVSLVSNGFI